MHAPSSSAHTIELAMVKVPGCVGDERMYSAMNFIRSGCRRRLQAPHLTACARLVKDVLFTPPPFRLLRPSASGMLLMLCVGATRALPSRVCSDHGGF
jgi:hypothetical protein